MSGELTLTLVIERTDSHFIGYVKEFPGANTQGDTLEEVMENIQEAIGLVLMARFSFATEQIKETQHRHPERKTFRQPVVVG